MTRDLDAARQVVELITGGWRAQALYTAVKLELPDHIAAGRTTDADLASATGAKEDGIHRLMRLLVAMGVFAGTPDTGYRNTPVSTALLDGPESMRDMCLLYGEEFYAAWAHAHEAITTVSSGFELAYGQPLYSYLGRDPDTSARFQGAMKAGNLFFEYVPDVFDFSGKTVVDLGGGNGALLAAILSSVPDARGVLMDREHVAPVARAHLAATVGADRVEVVGGDMFSGVPAGGDVYLLCRVLAGHSDDAVVGLFEHIRRGMADASSRLLLLDRLVVEENSTVLPALWDLHLLMTTGGRHRSLEHLRALLTRAGLYIERSADLPVETTALIAAARY
ncbi:MAG TPA: methyltransferase [Actinophytocola sp.]|uniref:methyltransferase n=1 Tax=Actinophytocola sp. TaxID=1872138 RepID=UPI002DDD75A5|nr:methyltransferase [Actinophytocola sp.]HEV2783949.1 methyltransferase [Actinophytocola sp.]